jgi:O-antigen/teichoic acid export membrane protein
LANKSKKILTYVFANGVNFVISFFTLPILSRALAMADYAAYNQVLILSLFTVSIFSLGLPQTINVFLGDASIVKHKLFGTINTMLILSFVLLFFSAFLVSGRLPIFLNINGIGVLFLMALPAVIFQILCSLLQLILINDNKISVVSISTIIANLIRFCLLIYAAKYFKSVESLIIAFTIGYFLQLIWLFIYCRKDVTFGAKYFDRNIAKSILHISYPYLVTNCLSQIILYGSAIIVSNQLGSNTFAIYRNGALEIPFLAQIATLSATVILPDVVKLYYNNQITDFLNLKKNIAIITAIIIYPIVVFCLGFAPVLIPLYFGITYKASVSVFIIYNVGMLFRLLDYQDILLVAKKTTLIMKISIISAIISLIASIVLTKTAGKEGAAFSYLIGLACLVFLLIYYTIKHLKINIFEYLPLKQIGSILFISMVLILPALFLSIQSIWAIMLYGFTYFVVCYTLFYKLNIIPQIIISKIINRSISK